jgi:hypothetical protein
MTPVPLALQKTKLNVYSVQHSALQHHDTPDRSLTYYNLRVARTQTHHPSIYPAHHQALHLKMKSSRSALASRLRFPVQQLLLRRQPASSMELAHSNISASGSPSPKVSSCCTRALPENIEHFLISIVPSTLVKISHWQPQISYYRAIFSLPIHSQNQCHSLTHQKPPSKLTEPPHNQRADVSLIFFHYRTSKMNHSEPYSSLGYPGSVAYYEILTKGKNVLEEEQVVSRQPTNRLGSHP